MPETLRNALGRRLLDELSLIAIMELGGQIGKHRGWTRQDQDKNDGAIDIICSQGRLRYTFAESLIIIEKAILK